MMSCCLPQFALWWLLTVPEVPGVVSQVKARHQADEYVPEAIAFVPGVEPDAFAITVDPQLPEDVAQALEARAAVRGAEEEQAKAAAALRLVARRLKSRGRGEMREPSWGSANSASPSW